MVRELSAVYLDYYYIGIHKKREVEKNTYVRDMKKCKKYRRFFVTFAKTKIQGILQ
jgi:hypothetical protein